MSFKIDPKKTGGLEGGGRKLKIGQHPYEIVEAAYLPNKSDPTGKEKQVVISLSDNDGSYKVYLAVNSSNDVQAEIATKTLVSFWNAAGLTGVLAPEGLKKLAGKVVVIEAKETAGKGANVGKTYVNISGVEAYEGGENEEADTEEESEEEETEEEEEEEEESPASDKPASKKKPWE